MPSPWGKPSPAWTELTHSLDPIRIGGARSAHRGEDISIEAFDGHWPAPISRVRGPRPRRSPGTSGGSPWGSPLAPLLLALFLLPYPHQLHTASLPADDHCEGVGREESQGSTRVLSTLPTWWPRASRFPLSVTPLPFPFLVSHLPDGTSLLFISEDLYGRFLDSSPAVIPLPTLSSR